MPFDYVKLGKGRGEQNFFFTCILREKEPEVVSFEAVGKPGLQVR
jgi:hypothetical protein